MRGTRRDRGGATLAARLERVELLMPADAAAKLSAVTLLRGRETRVLDFSYLAATRRLVVRAPAVPMADDWTISFG